MKIFLLLPLLLVGCASSSAPWHLDSITAGDPLFDSNRLTYVPLTGYPPWKIEFVNMGGETDVFISLLQYQFHSKDPSKIRVVLKLEERQIEELAPLFEGNMRIRLKDSMADSLIQSLQQGKKVGILVDGLEETIDPGLFNKHFSQLDKGGFHWLHIQNPLQ